jgi:hypothetical protein
MKRKYIYIQFAILIAALMVATACEKKLNEPEENKTYTGGTDYTDLSNMIKPLIGIYVKLSATEWENYPLIAVRGDDVNAGGQGDQQDYAETDKYNYNKDYWMYNSVWQNHYIKITNANSAIEQLGLYNANASNKALGNQYIAEVRVLRAYWLLQLSRVWGPIPIPIDPDPTTLYVAPLSTKDEVMQHISDQIDMALPYLPDMRPNQRTDIPGAVTKYTALAVKALANLELKKYQIVADATSEIIKSQKFSLEPDF